MSDTEYAPKSPDFSLEFKEACIKGRQLWACPKCREPAVLLEFFQQPVRLGLACQHDHPLMLGIASPELLGAATTALSLGGAPAAKQLIFSFIEEQCAKRRP